MAVFTDEELLALLKNDDRKAFAELYERYWERMIAKVYAALGVTTDAEEIVQDTFVDLWEQRHTIFLKYSFKTYISAVVKYKIFAKIGQLKKDRERAAADIETIEFIDDSTQQRLEFDDLKLSLESAMELLPEKCKLIFSLSRFQELSNEEIAQSLDISKKTVEAHITKALKTLRGKIDYTGGVNIFVVLFVLEN